MENKADYSKYECPYSHLEKEEGHELRGPEGYEGVYGVWCSCGFRGPVFYLDPGDLGLKPKYTRDRKEGTEVREVKDSVWILTSEVNDYSQYGEYFEAVFKDKPTIEYLGDLIGDDEKLLNHVLARGGRRWDEPLWYYLTEVKFN